MKTGEPGGFKQQGAALDAIDNLASVQERPIQEAPC